LILGGLVCGLVSPSSAVAVCARRSPAAVSRQAEVIVDAVALPGPARSDGALLSPARFRVERYDKGTGPKTIEAVTGDLPAAYVSEGLHVRAGERWRLIGSPDGAGRFVSDCGASARVPDDVLAPMIRRGSRWITLVRSRYSGRGAIRPPVLDRSALLRVAVRDGDERPVVRVGSRVLALRRAGPNRFVAHLPSHGGGRRVVVETRWGFWAGVLRSTR
jgi:hypothetical protein